jgi:hypothetical protein
MYKIKRQALGTRHWASGKKLKTGYKGKGFRIVNFKKEE